MTQLNIILIMAGINVILIYLFVRASINIKDIKELSKHSKLDSAAFLLEKGRIMEHLNKPEDALQNYLESMAMLKIYKKNECTQDFIDLETIERTLEINIKRLKGSMLDELYY